MAKKNRTAHTPDVSNGTVDLSQKAVLVLAGFSQWTGRKIDVDATREVVENANAVAGAGRFNKSLLPGNDLLQRIAKNISDFRQDFHYKNTLPWGDDGWRLLPAKRIGEYRTKFRQHKDIHDELVAQFVDKYPEYVEAAKTTLGKLFKHSDYPPSHEIKGKYRFSADWSNIDTADDLRVQVSEDVAKEIKKEIEENTKAKLTGAVADTYEKVSKAVAAVVEKLTDKPDGDHKIFRNSLIGNVRELAEVLPALNVTDDPNLARIADALHTKIAQLDPDELRDDADKRKDVVKTATEILDDLKGVF